MDKQSSSVQPTDTSAVNNASCAKCDEYLAGWKRAQADYQNLQRETERQKADYVKFANERLLKDQVLPTLDKLDLALSHDPQSQLTSLSEEDLEKWKKWWSGMLAVKSIWEESVKSIGLFRISAEGMFDPNFHEAVGEKVVEGKEPGSIVDWIQNGWTYQGKVLRPAKVIIAK